jgi:hypothetical protein
MVACSSNQCSTIVSKKLFGASLGRCHPDSNCLLSRPAEVHLGAPDMMSAGAEAGASLKLLYWLATAYMCLPALLLGLHLVVAFTVAPSPNPVYGLTGSAAPLPGLPPCRITWCHASQCCVLSQHQLSPPVTCWFTTTPQKCLGCHVLWVSPQLRSPHPQASQSRPARQQQRRPSTGLSPSSMRPCSHCSTSMEGPAAT